MLPNWLLGKSKSKLQEILGGGGGGGTSYTAGDGIDISNGVISFNPETTPVINPSKVDGLDDDLAALAPKTALSNPNILHNPWFTVNQRGATSVTASNGFIADRWRVYTTLSSFEVTRNSDGCIVIDNTSGDAIITVFQKRTSTYINSLLGKKVTASIMLGDGTIHSGTVTYEGAVAEPYFENDDIRLYAPAASVNQILALSVKPGASVTIKALKLEVGEVSTLHLDPRPEYAIELAKCQRYFYKIKTLAPHITYFQSATEARTVIITPVPMRTTPTIALPDNPDFNQCQIYTADGMLIPSAITISSNVYHNDGITNELILVSTVTGATINANGVQRFNIDIDFNAEL